MWSKGRKTVAPKHSEMAAIPSMRQYETSGYVAMVLPFFSEVCELSAMTKCVATGSNPRHATPSSISLSL